MKTFVFLKHTGRKNYEWWWTSEDGPEKIQHGPFCTRAEAADAARAAQITAKAEAERRP